MTSNLLSLLGESGDERDQDRLKHARIAFDAMAQFMGLLDAEGTVLEINKVALDGVGLKLSDVEGLPFWKTFWWQVSPEVNDTLRQSILRAAKGEFVRWDAEIYGRASGTETIIIDASLSPMKDQHGVVAYICAEGRDITEKKAYEREIARQREELAQLDVLKTQFFANVSHEFRTPLTLMLGPLEEVLSDTLDRLGGHQRERLAMVQRNGLRLQKLVNSLLDFSRVEAGRAQAFYEAIDLAEVTRDLASSFRSICEKAGLYLEIDAPPLADAVFVDVEMWEKIVLNLISNAFKFTLDGGIKISVRAESGAAVLRIEDTGTGIADGELPLIFDRFHRVESSGGRSHEGTGIGLSLVRELVKLHSGSIQVDSVMRQGSVFTVRLPFGSAHLAQARIGQPGEARATTRTDVFANEALGWLTDNGADPKANIPVGGAGAPGVTELDELPMEDGGLSQGHRVLLADDNADMRAYIRRLLTARGYDVQCVENGESALAAVAEQLPDLVISDVMMPKLDGFGLLQALRGDERTRELPVILLSARAGDHSKVEGLEAGADDYLVKPFSARELLSRVGVNIAMARVRRDAAERVAASEARFRGLVEEAADGIFVTHADGRYIEVNPAGCSMLGMTRAEVLARSIADVLDPTEHHRIEQTIANFADGKVHRSEWHFLRKDGSTFVGEISGRRLADGGLQGVVRDITERKQAEEASARLAAIIESSHDAIVSNDLNGRITSWNASAERLFGYTDREAIGQPVVMLMPPEGVDKEPGILDRIRHGERVEPYETVRRHKDGTLLEVSLTISSIVDSQGKVVGASKIARDIRERKSGESQTHLLMSELDHRVKNILATVSSVVTQTLNTADTPANFAASVEGRINALSRAHSALTQNGGGGGALDDIFKTELEAYDDGAERVKIDGPEVMLTPKASLALSMAIHELATNAAKYGALSMTKGRLDVTWKRLRDPDPAILRVVWAETCGPAVKPPTRRGFGTTLIERALAYEFDATVHREFLPSGLRCVIEMPLTVETSPPPPPPAGLSSKGDTGHE